MTYPALQPYLFFNGRTEEAIAFYIRALSAKQEMLLRFKDAPESPPPGTVPDGWDDKVMHASIEVGGTRVMMSDGCGPSATFAGFSLSLEVADADEAGRVFRALSEGGQVTMPLGQTFWSPCFGMVTDKFGVGWMIGVEDQAPAA